MQKFQIRKYKILDDGHFNGPFPIVGHMITFLFTRKQLILQKLFQQEQALLIACLSDNNVETFSLLSNLLVNRPFMLTSDVTTRKPGSDFDWLIVQTVA